MANKFKALPPVARKQRFVGLGSTESEWISLGRLAEVGPKKEVRLGMDYEHVLAIVGKRGSGKSFTLGSFLEGIATEQGSTCLGMNAHRRAALLFDTLNIFQWMTSSVTETSRSTHVAEQRREFERWGLEKVDLNIDLWVPAGYENKVTSRARPFRIRTQDMQAADWAALFGVDAVQDVMGQLVTQVLQNVTVRGWARDDRTRVEPRPDYAISDLIECLEHDSQIPIDYAPATTRAIRQRLQSYAASPLFGLDGTPLNELLVAGRLSIMLLSGVPDDVRLSVIYLLIRKLLQGRAAASEAAKSVELGFNDESEAERLQAVLETAPPKSWVVIDEAQNVFPSEKQTSASASLLRFVREGRNFGLSLAFTTQQPTAIDPRIMSQVDTFIVHTLTVDKDISAVRSNLKSSEPAAVSLEGRSVSTADSIRQLGVGQAFVSSVDTERCLYVDIRPRVSTHGGFEG